MTMEDMNKEKLMRRAKNTRWKFSKHEIQIMQREHLHEVEVAVINGKKCIKCVECGAQLDADSFNKIIDTFGITENTSSGEIEKQIDNLIFVRNLIKGHESR